MLAAIREEIKLMAQDPSKPVYWKIRERVGKRAANVLEGKVLQLIQLMPKIMERMKYIHDLSERQERSKKLESFVFSYVFHPYDFVCKETHGLFGYLDDAYLVAIIYEDLMTHGTSFTMEDMNYLEIIRKSKPCIESILPEETRLIREMVASALIENDFEKFAQAFRTSA